MRSGPLLRAIGPIWRGGAPTRIVNVLPEPSTRPDSLVRGPAAWWKRATQRAVTAGYRGRFKPGQRQLRRAPQLHPRGIEGSAQACNSVSCGWIVALVPCSVVKSDAQCPVGAVRRWP